jgi:Fe-S cluster biogenesis protein NfuA
MTVQLADGARVQESVLTDRVRQICEVMAAHAGGIEVDQVSSDGDVRVKFTGMCTGCLLRPVTMAGTIRPALLSVPGVRSVHAAGSRVSEFAEERIVAALEDSGWRTPLLDIEPLGGGRHS